MFSKLFEKIHLLQNLYLKNRCFLKRQSYAMDGEDMEISKYFKNKKNGFYVDVGAYHPIERNNTMLLYEQGWEGINIDISNFSIQLFNHLRPRDINLNLAISGNEGDIEMYFQKKLSQLSTIKKNQAKRSFQGEVKTQKIFSKTLTSVLDSSKFKERKIDLLDIDVEGADIDVLESLDFERYSPELVCVEVIEENNEDSRIFSFLRKKGYTRIWSGVFSHIFKKS